MKDPSVACKLMTIAFEFFEFHDCTDIQVKSHPSKVVEFLSLGFLPLENDLSVRVVSSKFKMFNALYSCGHDFTREEFEIMSPEYKVHLARRLDREPSTITFEDFLAHWPWTDPTTINTYKITDLARKIFLADKTKVKDIEFAQEVLETQESIPLYLSKGALRIYKEESLSFPDSSFSRTCELRSIWLPSHPKERIFTVGNSAHVDIYKIEGPFYRDSEVIFQITAGKTLGVVEFSITGECVRINRLRVIKDIPAPLQKVIFSELINVAVEAAFTNTHCRGLVKCTTTPNGFVAEACRNAGFVEDLSVSFKRLDLREAHEATVLTTFILNKTEAKTWERKFYTKRLEEEILLIAKGNHPHLDEESPKREILLHNTLVQLLRKLDQLMIGYDSESDSFSDKVLEFYNAHTESALEEEFFLLCERPKILYCSIHKALSECCGVTPDREFLRKKINFDKLFTKLEHVSFLNLLSGEGAFFSSSHHHRSDSKSSLSERKEEKPQSTASVIFPPITGAQERGRVLPTQALRRARPFLGMKDDGTLNIRSFQRRTPTDIFQ